MNPKVKDFSENKGTLTFTLYNCNYSMANAIRRTISSDIETVVIHTDDDSVIENTSRLNNEIIRQRLGCIPVHITDKNIPIKNYIIEINESNDDNKIKYVTTENIKIKDTTTNTYLSREIVQQIFPKNLTTDYFIDILRLRPKLYEGHIGEKIHIKCNLKYGTASEDGMYNVISTCSYGNTIDNGLAKNAFEKELEKHKNVPEEQLEKIKKDWNILNKQRYFIKNSFDFKIETVGVFKNLDLVKNAIHIIIKKLHDLIQNFQHNASNIISELYTTNGFCYELNIEGMGYTIGKLMEHKLYEDYFDKSEEGIQILNFCGFIKKHPHINSSIIKLGFNEEQDNEKITLIIINTAKKIIKEINTLITYFD